MIGLTSGLPKELLIAGGLPAVEHVARECSASGITDLMIVIAPGKQTIEAHFARRAGTAGLPERIVFTVQREPRGLADAIRLGRDFALHGPIAVALPDNLFVAEQPALSQVLSVARATGKSAVAVAELTSGAAAKQDATTIYDGAPVSGTDEFRVTRIPNKGTRSATFDSGDAALAGPGSLPGPDCQRCRTPTATVPVDNGMCRTTCRSMGDARRNSCRERPLPHRGASDESAE